MLIPAMLSCSVSSVKRSSGSITNFYVTPVTRLEFLLGKQIPYLAIALRIF